MHWLSTRGRLTLTVILVALLVGMSSSSGLAGERRPPKHHVPKVPVTLPVIRTNPLPEIGDPRGSFNDRSNNDGRNKGNHNDGRNKGHNNGGRDEGNNNGGRDEGDSAAPSLAAPSLAAPSLAAPSLAAAAPTVSSPSISAISAIPCATPALDLKLLVISADGSEVTLPAIRQTLDFLGTPYTVWTARQRPGALTGDVLAGGAGGCHGFYDGVILATGALSYSPDGGITWASALSAAEWQTLTTYEANLKVRRASWYTYPTAGYGFVPPTRAVDTATAPINATYTTAGQSVFSYANTANPLTISGAYTYLAQPLDAATTPLLVDSAGNALVALRSYPDGRQAVSLTMASNQYLTHSLVLSYGIINWVTGGLFLGERKAHLGVQIDDLFAEDDTWVGRVCETCAFYRITGDEFHKLLLWQQQKNTDPLTASLHMSFAFNGQGTTGFVPDTLTPQVRTDEFDFMWINHTFTHANLDALSYGASLDELRQNDAVAQDIAFEGYNIGNLVTPEISGLSNPEFLRAAKDFGIRYVVSDTSRPGGNNPSPNAGFYNPYQPSILTIPRHPVNLFYNVGTPAEWVDEYNFIYRTFWGRNLTYAEILDKESQMLVTYLLRWDMDPLMFHQTNVRSYDGVHSLLTDLLDLTFAKYGRLVNIPTFNSTMDALGTRMAQRMALKSSGVVGSVVPGGLLTLTNPGSATVIAAVTGAATPGAESYGGQLISYITLAPLQSVSMDIAPPTWPTSGTLSASAVTGTSLTLNWPAATDNVGVTGYRVFQDGTLLATLGAGGRTSNVTGLTPAFSYAFAVQAGDAAGNWSTNLSATVTTLDTIPPTWPPASTLTPSAITRTGATLTWTAATDNVDVTAYRVYQNGVLIATVEAFLLTLDVVGLASNTPYTFRVQAGDAAGNWTTNGPSATLTTLP